MNARSSGFSWTSLLLGIVALVAAGIAFADPAANLLALTIFLGIAALIVGVIQIYCKFAPEQVPGASPNILLFLGILNVIFAIILLANLWTGLILLPILFSIWFIIASVLMLTDAWTAKFVSKGYYWFKVILCVLGIIIGILLLFDPLFAALTLSFLVGFYFLFFAINYFVDAFSKNS